MGGGVVANLGHALAIRAISGVVPAVADEMVYTGRDVALLAQPVIPDAPQPVLAPVNGLNGDGIRIPRPLPRLVNPLDAKVESRDPRGFDLGCAPRDDRRAVGPPLAARQRQRVERRPVVAVCAEDVDRGVLAARLVQGRG